MNECSTTLLRVYTDEEAVREGLLIPIVAENGVNRVSRAVYDAFVTPAGDAEPVASDVTALLDAIRAVTESGPDTWRSGSYRGTTLWLLPNETGGFTLMLPPQPTALR